MKLCVKILKKIRRSINRWKAVIEFQETVKELTRIRKEDALNVYNKNCRNVGNYK